MVTVRYVAYHSNSHRYILVCIVNQMSCKQADCRPQPLHQKIVIPKAMPSMPQTVFILIMGNQVIQRAYNALHECRSEILEYADSRIECGQRPARA